MSTQKIESIRDYRIYLITDKFEDFKLDDKIEAPNSENAIEQWCVKKGYKNRGPINRKRTRFYIDTREGGQTKLINVMVI